MITDSQKMEQILETINWSEVVEVFTRAKPLKNSMFIQWLREIQSFSICSKGHFHLTFPLKDVVKAKTLEKQTDVILRLRLIIKELSGYSMDIRFDAKDILPVNYKKETK